MKTIDTFDPKTLSGRNRRLLHEWREMTDRIDGSHSVSFSVEETNTIGLPTAYLVNYDLLSISGIDTDSRPIFTRGYKMMIELPDNYPCADGAPHYHFLVNHNGKPIAHPWHPNIRYYGAFAGRVCLNAPDTYASLAWATMRIAEYLEYNRYHASNIPPYPEDLKVAQWVVELGEPNGWIFFEQNKEQ